MVKIYISIFIQQILKIKYEDQHVAAVHTFPQTLSKDLRDYMRVSVGGRGVLLVRFEIRPQLECKAKILPFSWFAVYILSNI